MREAKNFKPLQAAFGQSAALCVLLSAGTALAGQNFDIPAQMAVTAIPEFALQAGIQILAPAGPLRDIRTEALKGNYDVREGLERLLRGTGLIIATDIGNIITLRQSPKRADTRSTPDIAPRTRNPQAEVIEHQPPPYAGGIEEVFVTARRVVENIQRVPIAVSVLTQAELQNRNVTDVSRLQVVVPAFTTAAGNRGSFAWMRGLQGIAGYYADAPFPIARFGQSFDIGNFQVLKGPQGTLFGSSSASGAMVWNPVRPSNKTDGFIQARTGSYGLRALQGALNVPVVEDRVLTRIAFDSYGRNGYVTDIASGKKYLDEDHYTIRPSLILKPTENFENYTMFHYYYSRNNGRRGFYKNYLPSIIPGTCDAQGANCTPSPYTQYLTPEGITFAGPAAIEGQFIGATPLERHNTLDRIVARHKLSGDLGPFRHDGLIQAGGLSGELDRHTFIVNRSSWNASASFGITNIFSYYRAETRIAVDPYGELAGVIPHLNDPRVIADRLVVPTDKSWANETKAEGQVLDGAITYTVGTIHAATDFAYDYTWGNARNVLTTTLMRGNPRRPARSRAVYAQGTADLSPWVEGLSVTAGYRYTWDTVNQFRATFRPDLDTTVPRSDFPIVSSTYLRKHFSFDNWTAGAQYQFSNDTMFYLTGSKGVTTGQVSLQGSNPITFPETLKQIEGGMKSTFSVGDIQARTNVSLYYGWYSNIQVSVVRSTQQNPLPAPPTAMSQSENAAEGLVRGIDFDMQIVPVEWFELGFAFAYNKNIYTSWLTRFRPTDQIIDRSDLPYLGNPRFKYQLNGTIHLPVDRSYGQMSVRADYAHSSRTNYDGVLTYALQVDYTVHSLANGYGPFSADNSLVPANAVPPHGLLDLSFHWNNVMNVTGLDATVTVTNVTNIMPFLDSAYQIPSGGQRTTVPDPPRMFTVGFKYTL